MSLLLLTIPSAPLTTALLVRLFGRRLPRQGGWLTVLGTAVALVAVLLLLGNEAGFTLIWAQTGGYTLTLGLAWDGLARVMALLVASVGLLISIYAVSYMAEETDQPRFFATFAFFIGTMLALVLANSFVLLFAAWEGVGLASFLLIGFWYRQEDARRAAQTAFLMTRLGDLGLLLGWLWALRLTGTTDITPFLAAIVTPALPSAALPIIALLFFAAALGKSAQLPLIAWLPAAMAGPTPVSALIHSATMVAAGVYLLLRLFPLFAAVPAILAVVLWVGGLTALIAAFVASIQTDLKRILAWSTVSQLGEMMLALGLGGPLAAAFHLVTHATFKSTLFLAAGAIDHATGTRDLRQLGGLARVMPVTTLVFGAAALALAGVPPLSGFWSEETILAHAAEAGIAPALLLLALIFLAGVYISRAGVAIFAAWRNTPHPDAHDPGRVMTIPMIILALAALGIGWVLSGRIEDVLRFPASPEPGWGWRSSAILASLAGLALGAARAWRSGPVPTFGAWPILLEGSIARIPAIPVHLAFALARTTNGLEAGFDRSARAVSTAVHMFAAANSRIEQQIDAGAHTVGTITRALAAASNGVERQFDRASSVLSAATLTGGRAAEANETRGLAFRLDRFANLFNRAGGRLRPLQSGKIYLYTLGLFIWVLVVSVAGGVLLWL